MDYSLQSEPELSSSWGCPVSLQIYHATMHEILLAGAPSCNLELLDNLQNRYVWLLLVLHLLPLLKLWLIVEM